MLHQYIKVYLCVKKKNSNIFICKKFEDYEHADKYYDLNYTNYKKN